MSGHSEYELETEPDVQRFQGRPLSITMRNAGEHVLLGPTELGKPRLSRDDLPPIAPALLA